MEGFSSAQLAPYRPLTADPSLFSLSFPSKVYQVTTKKSETLAVQLRGSAAPATQEVTLQTDKTKIEFNFFSGIRILQMVSAKPDILAFVFKSDVYQEQNVGSPEYGFVVVGKPTTVSQEVVSKTEPSNMFYRPWDKQADEFKVTTKPGKIRFRFIAKDDMLTAGKVTRV